MDRTINRFKLKDFKINTLAVGARKKFLAVVIDTEVSIIDRTELIGHLLERVFTSGKLWLDGRDKTFSWLRVPLL